MQRPNPTTAAVAAVVQGAKQKRYQATVEARQRHKEAARAAFRAAGYGGRPSAPPPVVVEQVAQAADAVARGDWAAAGRLVAEWLPRIRAAEVADQAALRHLCVTAGGILKTLGAHDVIAALLLSWHVQERDAAALLPFCDFTNLQVGEGRMGGGVV